MPEGQGSEAAAKGGGVERPGGERGHLGPGVAQGLADEEAELSGGRVDRADAQCALVLEMEGERLAGEGRLIAFRAIGGPEGEGEDQDVPGLAARPGFQNRFAHRRSRRSHAHGRSGPTTTGSSIPPPRETPSPG